MAKKHRRDRAKPDPVPEQRPRFPGWLAWPVLAGWGLFVLKHYYARYPVNLKPLASLLSPGQYAEGFFSVLPGHLLTLAAALFFVFACFALGRAALRAAGFSFSGALEEISFSCGAGLGLLAAYVFVLAALKLLYFWPVAAALLAAAAAGIWQLKKAPLSAPEGAPASLGPADLAALAVLLLALLLNLAASLGPEIFYDSLVYHLAVPNFYVIRHGFEPMPYNFYSNMPFTHGMLYSAALLLKGEALPKFVNYAAGALAVLAVISAGARYFSLRAGIWAALIFYTVNHAMYASWSAGTEALLMLFATLALLSVLRRSDGEPRWLWLAACFCGLSMGVKYTGLFPVAGVMLVYAWSDRARPAAALKNLAVFTLIASAFTGPWLVKNYLYTGNPVFPFALNLFGAGATADPQKLAEFASQAAQMEPFTPKGWLLTHWKVTLGQVPNSEYFSPLFLALLPAAFLLPAAPAGAALTALWTFFLVCWLGWSFTSTMVRFLMPAYPAAGLIMAAYLFSPGHGALKAVLKAAALFVCLSGLYLSALMFYTHGRWRPVTGAVPVGEYLSRTQPTYPYSGDSGLRFMNEKTPPGSKALLIGDERSFYLKRDFIVSSVYDRAAIVEYAAAARDGEDLYRRLKAEGVTHLLVNVMEAVRLGRAYRMFYWDARAQKVFYDFWDRHARSVFSYEEVQGGRPFNRVEVYELADKLPPGVPPAFNVMREVIMPQIGAPRP